MGLFSLLPEHLSFIETWIARIFFVLAVISLGPWALFLAYDLALYIWRCATYYIPYVGGKARGRQRPRAPSLTERPDGHRRQISLPGVTSRRSEHGSDGIGQVLKHRLTNSLPSATTGNLKGD